MKTLILNSKLNHALIMLAVIIGAFSMTSCKKEIILTVGMEHQDGIIVSIDKTGKHGLLMATEGVEKTNYWSVAKEQCETYNDGEWRLPTKEEMLIIHGNNNILNLEKGRYWTSTLHEENDWVVQVHFETGIYLNGQDWGWSYLNLCGYKKYCSRPVKDF